MVRRTFTAPVTGGQVTGWTEGDGEPVLLLHGGPGLSFGYLDDVSTELGPDRCVAAFQQRGLAPSMTDGPYDVDTHIADVVAVLETLGWSTAYVVGHSWGGHLALHLAVAIPQRLRGVLCVDPLGGVGDGGEAAFSAALFARLSRSRRKRARASGEPPDPVPRATDAESGGIETLRMFWPAYFAVWDEAPPVPGMSMSDPAYLGGLESARARLPELERALPSITVATGVLAGAASPMPVEEAAAQTAETIPGAWLEVVPDAGHFPWVEAPGCVGKAFARLAGG